MTKEDLVRVFADTERLCREEARLRQAVEKAAADTRFYAAEEIPALPVPRYGKTAVVVTRRRSFETAMAYRQQYPEARIAVHNFASATNPGGGVRHGSRAQEESLCRCSTLLFALETETNKKRFYEFHRKRQDTLYTDACLYTPEVVVFKSDDDAMVLLPERQWATVDVLTCAAPNLRFPPYNAMNPGRGEPARIGDDALMTIHERRGRHLLAIAAVNGADVVVLGAFGCGAFRNPPEVVARAYHQILPEFRGQFREIAFAVFCPPRDSRNYDTFRRVLGERSEL